METTKQRRPLPNDVAPSIDFDPRLRYPVPEASVLLRQSVAKTWRDIKDKLIVAIRDGGRTYVPGSEIARRSALPDHPSAPAKSTVTPLRI